MTATDNRIPPPANFSPPPRRSRRGVWIALTAGTVVLLGAAGVGVTLMGVGIAKGLDQDTVARSYHGVTRIVVDVDEGTVSLRGSAGPDVEVSSSRAWTPGYEPVLRGGVEGGVLTLTSDCPDMNFGCETDQRISVPAGIPVSVHTLDGVIDASGLDTPRFSASTIAGPVTASFARTPDDVRVETVAGPVRVTVPQGRYQVEASTTIGPVHVGVVQDSSAPHTISAKTVTGPVDIVGN